MSWLLTLLCHYTAGPMRLKVSLMLLALFSSLKLWENTCFLRNSTTIKCHPLFESYVLSHKQSVLELTPLVFLHSLTTLSLFCSVHSSWALIISYFIFICFFLLFLISKHQWSMRSWIMMQMHPVTTVSKMSTQMRLTTLLSLLK